MKNEKYNRDTVGLIVAELLEKPLETNDPREQGEAMTKKYMDNLAQAVERGKNEYPGQDFFVEVLIQRPRLLTLVIRTFFIPRSTCSTPNYDQAVFHYHHKHDALEFLWVIPDREAAWDLKLNAHIIDPELAQLTQFVLDFDSGELFKKAQKLNNEDVLVSNVILKEFHE